MRAYPLWPSALALLVALDGFSAAQAADLEEILVTARKRTESIQDIPVSITAIGADRIDRHDLTSIEKISNYIPNFVIGRSSNGSGAQLTLRGIGPSSATSIGIEQSVAVIVDGAYYGHGRVINEGLFDLEQIEVLRGPQALFYGKNATAGVISLRTANPTEDLEILARAGYEFNSETIIGEAVGSGPLTDQLGIRIALRGSEMFGGYFRNLAAGGTYTTVDSATGASTQHAIPVENMDMPGERDIMGRLTLQWKPDEQFSATLKVSATRNRLENSSWNFGVFACPTGASASDPGLACGSRFASTQYAFPEAMAASVPYSAEGARYNSYAVTGELEYEFDTVTITSVSNFQQNKNSWSSTGDYWTRFPTGVWTSEWSSWRALSTEIRALTSYDGPVNVMLGAYYQDTKRKFDQFVPFAGAENSLAAPENRYLAFSKNSESDGETLSGFGQVIWDVLPTVEFTAGLRYTHETKSSYFVHPYVNPLYAGLFVPNVVVSADQTFDDWSPEATITWKPQEDWTVYGAFKTAYKSGGFSNSGILSGFSTVDDFAFEPEKARGFEGGVKAALFDRALVFDLGVYRYKYKNLQVDFFNSPTFAFITTNAGSVKSEGVEFSAQWFPQGVDGLNLRGSLNYNNTRYGTYIAPCYAGQTPAAGCTGLSDVGTPLQDLRGARTAAAPKWTASLGGSYETPLNDSLLMGFVVDSRYSGSYLASGFGNPLSRQDDYINLDAGVHLRTADEQWEIALIGKNLTNEYIVGGVFEASGTGGGTGTADGFPADQIGFISLPRTVKLQVTWRY